jgi:hypothetical protein
MNRNRARPFYTGFRTPPSPSPDIAEIITRSARDFDGHFAANRRDSLNWNVLNVSELVDEAGCRSCTPAAAITTAAPTLKIFNW